MTQNHSPEYVLLPDGRLVPAVAWAARTLLRASGVDLVSVGGEVRMTSGLPADHPLRAVLAPHREVLRQLAQAEEREAPPDWRGWRDRPAVVGRVDDLVALVERRR